MKNRVCKLSYHSYGKTALDTFANGVKNGIFSNPTVFATPPLTEDELKHIIADYSTALADYEAYGKTYKTAYLNAKGKLMSTLDVIAAYVNGVANGDPSIISLAGYLPTAGSSQAAPMLEKILTVVVTATNVSGQVIIETPAITGKGVTGYGLILVSGAPLTVDNFSKGIFNLTAIADQKVIIDFTKGKKKVIDGLDSSMVYYGYMFATNSVSVSPLSDVRTVKCI